MAQKKTNAGAKAPAAIDDGNVIGETRMDDNGRKVRTLTYKGVTFDFRPGVFRDQRGMYIIGKLNDKPNMADVPRLQARLFDILLGEDAYEVMDGIAEANGGMLDEEAFGDFIKFLMEAAQAKN